MVADLSTVETVDVPGARLRTEVAGAGPALLFLHGWTLDRRMWRRQRAALADRFLVITPDRRGWGESTGAPDLAAEVDDVAALLDHVGAQRGVIIGASQAGRVALRFALAHPARTAALVLQGAALDGLPEPVDDPGYVPVDAWSRLVRHGRRGEFEQAWLAHPFMALPAGQEAVAREVAAMVHASPLRDLAGEAAPATPLNLVPELPHINVRTLVINGTDETPHRRRIGALLAQRIPGARHVDLPGGHLVNMTAPDTFNGTLARFLG